MTQRFKLGQTNRWSGPEMMGAQRSPLRTNKFAPCWLAFLKMQMVEVFDSSLICCGAHKFEGAKQVNHEPSFKLFCAPYTLVSLDNSACALHPRIIGFSLTTSPEKGGSLHD